MHHFIVSQSGTIKSAVVGGCRVSGEPMGFLIKKIVQNTIFSSFARLALNGKNFLGNNVPKLPVKYIKGIRRKNG